MPPMARASTAWESVGPIALPPELAGGMQLWLVDLDRYGSTVNIDSLQVDELARAQSFRFPRDRGRYIAARHALRSLLGAALGMPPEQLRVTVDPFGKPTLDHDSDRLQFNLSHSGHLAIIALCRDNAVGVDIELLRPLADAEDLAESHFTGDERRKLASAPSSTRDRAFLQCWTRKEACLKAVGVGLTIDPREIGTGCGTDRRSVLIPLQTRAVETLVWTLEIGSIPATIAAVAVVPAAGRSSDNLWSTAA